MKITKTLAAKKMPQLLLQILPRNNPYIILQSQTLFLSGFFAFMIQNIKHIILDLGGVLLDIDYQRTEDAFVELGMRDFAQHYTQAVQSDFFSDFETGKIDEQQFINGI